MTRLVFLLCLLAGLAGSGWAQKFTPPKPGSPASLVRRPLMSEKPVIWEDTLASDKRKKREKKIPKKTFWGIKTKKAYTKVVAGRKTTYELFYVLKKSKDPDPYVRELWWYHRKKRKVSNTPIPPKEKEYAVYLHGPYEKRINKVTVEQGQFYVGAKTGRWETNAGTEDEILLEKRKFYKGFPKEAKVTYYDANQTQVQEVIPYENGELHGIYLKYYQNGTLAEEGRYEFGQKIGVWKTYFENKKRVKLEIQYPPDAWAADTVEPAKLREFNEQGLVLYDKAVEDKKKREGKK